jgi:Tol biopolymer transport system component
MRRARRTAVSLAVLVLVALPGDGNTSSVAFPGTNGLIAFQSFRDGYSQIYVMTSRPTQPTKVPRQRSSCYALPAWSKDGKQIAFEFNPDREGRPADRSDIYVMNADGSRARNLTAALLGFSGDPAWSPDSKYVVFENEQSGNSDIYRVDVRTRKLQQLTTHKAPDEDPSWSPDGRRIAFTSARDKNREIYIMDRNGDRLSNPARNITRNAASDRNPSWSPKGDLVAFDSDRDRNLEIYATDERFFLRRLTNHPRLDALPAWAPDGKSIVFVSDREEPGNRDLYVMKTNGSSVRKLTQSPAWDVAPDWGSAPLRTIGRPPAALPPPGPKGDVTSAIACVVR